MSSRENISWRTVEVRAAKLGAAASACRYALSPLTKGVDVEVDEDAMQVQVAVAVEALVKAWRYRLTTLQQVGWVCVDTQKKLHNLGNCPPVGIAEAAGHTFACHRYQVCPFCWCRKYVLEVFARLRSFAKCFDKQNLPFDLVEVRTERLYPKADYLVSSPFDWIRHARAKYYRKHLSGAYGGFSLCTVEPPDYSRNQRYYKLCQRLLGVVPRNMENPPEEVIQGVENQTVTRKVRRTCNPSIKTMGAIVGRTCIYPRQLMLGSPADVLEILDAQAASFGKDDTGRTVTRYPVRMSAIYGELRKSHTVFEG